MIEGNGFTMMSPEEAGMRWLFAVERSRQEEILKARKKIERDLLIRTLGRAAVGAATSVLVSWGLRKLDKIF